MIGAAGAYFYRARYYDPQQARFLSQDPLGLAGGDTNLYRYAANNPIQISDPNGELAWFAIPIIWGAIEIGLSIYDAYDTASTLADSCKTAGEKWLAGGLFMLGAVLPGGWLLGRRRHHHQQARERRHLRVRRYDGKEIRGTVE